MQLFSTQINEIQDQIEALQAQQNRLQDLENATSEHIKGLDIAIKIAKDEGAFDAIAALKSAISGLFESAEQNHSVKAVTQVTVTQVTEGEGEIPSDTGLDTAEQQHELGTPEKPCPASTDGKCINPECKGETFTCEGYGKQTPNCYGGDGDELCNDCWHQSTKIDPVVLKDPSKAETEPEEASAPQFKKMFEGEPEPDEFGVVFYSDHLNRFENTLNIYFKLKREAKAWVKQFEFKYPDCIIEIRKDGYGGFNYVLEVTKNNPDDPQWWQEITSFDYSKSPEENGRNPRRLTALGKADQENRKPAVQQSDTSNEPLTVDVVDDNDPPAFTLIATGYGAMRVIKDDKVIGMVWPDAGKWTLEDGQAFNTQEEAVNALFNSTPSAA